MPHRSPDTAALDALADGLYAAALDGEHEAWEAALDRVADAFGADKAYLQPAGTGATWSLGGPITTRVDPSFGRSYVDYYGALDPLVPAAFQARGRDKALLVREIMDFPTHSRTEFYQEWCRPQGVGDTMFGFVVPDAPNGQGSWGCLALIRPTHAAHFDTGDRRRVEALLPHLRRAVSANLRLGRALAERDALAAGLERLAPRGAVLVDRHGRVVFATTAAEAILSSPGSPLVRGRDDTLVVTDRAPRSGLDDLGCLLAGVIGAGGRLRTGGKLRWPEARPSQALVPSGFTLEALPFQGAAGFGGPLALLLLGVPDPVRERPEPSQETFRECWGLTPTEAKAARHLAEWGPGAKTLARALGVSPNTARTHLQRLFDKTGVHSQAALVALLRNTGQR